MMKAYWIFRKDLKIELKTRYAINALLMFILVAISVILFSAGNESISENLSGGLLWVIVFFSAMSGLSRAFVSEEEKGTVLTLQLLARPSTVLTGKLIYNTLLLFSVNTVIVILYSALFPSFVLRNLLLFLASYVLGNAGIAISSTVIAAIISRAGAKGTLYPVLSFPILLPLILTLIKLTQFSIEGALFVESVVELSVLFCYDIIMLTASYLLFDFIWKD